MLLCFFFSSRRRHTRYIGDWSSDVCSSDLAPAASDAGLVTFTPDDIDWEDEVRLAIEERVSLSPDALTGMEASLRFAEIGRASCRERVETSVAAAPAKDKGEHNHTHIHNGH